MESIKIDKQTYLSTNLNFAPSATLGKPKKIVLKKTNQ